MNIKMALEFRKNFPILNTKCGKYDLVYLDNAAITQVPSCVIESLVNYYSCINSNVHRGVYSISEVATKYYEDTRVLIKEYINAGSVQECIFVKGTTEGINLVANSYVKTILKKDDEILISGMEHHSNIVPWYLLCKSVGAKLVVIPLLKTGMLDLNNIDMLLTPRTKIVSIVHISNSIGTVNNIKAIIKLAHLHGIPVLVDGAQSLSNMSIDVRNLDCDFFTLSSHKMYGPSGVGVLYGKKVFLDAMVPFICGGDMIKHVSYTNVIWNDLPYKFEAGTPSIANIIAFGRTIKFLKSFDFNELVVYKRSLYKYVYNKLSSISYVRILGEPHYESGIISFIIDGIHSHDFGTIANYYGIAVRTGHHCSIPVMDFYDVSSTIRVSLSFYNLKEEVDKFIDVILMAKTIFK